jgi:hypothetical protein
LLVPGSDQARGCVGVWRKEWPGPVLRAGLLLNIQEVSRLGTLSASADITPFELVRHIFRGSVSEIRMGRMGSDERNS